MIRASIETLAEAVALFLFGAAIMVLSILIAGAP